MYLFVSQTENGDVEEEPLQESVKGVKLTNDGKKYKATFKFNKKEIYCGLFDTQAEVKISLHFTFSYDLFQLKSCRVLQRARLGSKKLSRGQFGKNIKSISDNTVVNVG